MSGAHPRVCGENGLGCAVKGGESGSSPRVRGKLSPSRRVASSSGLIPACAGKTYYTP